MDLTIYYKKIRETEAELPEPCVVVSREAENGGRAGVLTEVPRRVAARMIVDGQARAATEQETRDHREAQLAAKRVADELAAASRMHVTVVPSSELRHLKETGRARGSAMALFTDGNISTINDLTAHDSGLMGLAGVEGIDLTVKLALAQEELGVELQALMPPEARLEGVVVTPPLRLWHAFHTLELIYRDAYNNQLNDRYKGKWEQYRELAGWATGKLLQTGVGITANPVAQAEAPELSVRPGGTAEEMTIYASVAWVNAEGEEGAASPWDLILVPAGCVPAVKAVRPPAAAAGWHVYAGTSGAELSRQNIIPLEIGVTWVQTEALADDRPRPGSGQIPTYLRALPTVLRRG